MKQLAVINKEVWEQCDPSESAYIKLNDTNIYFSLVESTINFNETDKPKIDDEHVIVKKIAFSVNYRDRSLILSASEFMTTKNMQFPFGSEFVGEVVYVGSKVNTLKCGDRVISNASMPICPGYLPGIPSNYASRLYEEFHPGKLLRVPENLPVDVAASFTIASQTAYSMVRRSQINAGEKVLITAGSSNTSLAMAEVLKKNKDINLFISTTSKPMEAFLSRQYNAKVITIDAQRPLADSFTNSDYSNFDVILDPFVDLHFPSLSIQLADYGRYVTCGFFRQHTKMGYADTQTQGPGTSIEKMFTHFMSKNISFIGNCLGTTTDLENALADYCNGLFDVQINCLVDNGDVQKFVNETFLKREKPGKVVYKY